MTELRLIPKTTMEIECVCFDQKPCDIRINDGGHLVCRHGSNEGVVDGVAKVICPLEIATEQVKWDIFLSQERRANTVAKKSASHK
ncbi:MAG: hypothetical protein M1540_00235 [Candidatus Bathyarchaeota archaeon]|nr:hypothetical protein [Candidatus Bathyarchaeota archaeon]